MVSIPIIASGGLVGKGCKGFRATVYELRPASILGLLEAFSPDFSRGYVRLCFPLIGGVVVKIVVKAEMV